MLFRKTILLLSAVALSLSTSCTTRYQDMLRERDERIRENGCLAEWRLALVERLVDGAS